MLKWDLLPQLHWLVHDESTLKLVFCLSSLFICFLGLFLATADNVSIASKEASHVVDVKEPKKSKKKVKKKNID